MQRTGTVALLTFLALFCATTARAQTGTFVATLAGANEVPGNSSTATGEVAAVLDGTTLTVTGAFSGLTADYTASHIHLGAVGIAGGVILTLAPTLDGDLRGGTYEAGSNTFVLTDVQVADLQNGLYYVNVHSVDLPGGEVRGQLFDAGPERFAARLTGDQEVPPADTPASGAVAVELSGVDFTVDGFFRDLTGDFTATHVHDGDFGVGGPVIQDIGGALVLDADSRGGTWDGTTVFTFTDAEAQEMRAEGTYVNVHSTTFGGGEVRGQILIAPTVDATLLDAPVEIPPGGGAFRYTLRLDNHATLSQTFDAWTEVVLPDASTVGPILGPVQVTLAGGDSIGPVRFVQNVPGGAPAGTYEYVAYTGVFPDVVYTQDSFTFTKAAAAAGAATADAAGTAAWTVTGAGLAAEGIHRQGAAHTASPGAAVPRRFALEPAYPNPFNPEATIRFTVEEEGPVRVELYDALGRRVQVLYDGTPAAGQPHELRLDGSALPGGVYFVRLSGSRFADIRRVTLLK